MLRRIVTDQRGTSAVEFALVIPLVATLLIGGINVLAMFWGQTALHYAVDSAARCWSVGYPTNSCTSPTTTVAYAKAQYLGPQLSQLTSWIATAPATAEGSVGGYCQLASNGNTSLASVPGYVVSASGAYKFDVGLFRFNVPISATACFPGQT